MSIKRVLLAGAGGNLGPAILKELISANYQVSVLTRPDSSSSFPAPVTVHKTDYSPASLTSILSIDKPDAVVSTLNLKVPAIYDAQQALIDAAKASGVKRFIPSEFGSDTINPEVSKIVPIYGNKLKAVEYLKTLQSDDFTWTAVLNGPFLDWGIQHGLISLNLKEKILYRWDDGSAPFTVSTLPFVGKAVASILSDSTKLAATANKYVYVAEHTVSNNEYIDSFLKVTQKRGETWTVEEIDSDVVLEKSTEAFKAGNGAAAVDLIKFITFSKRRLGGFEEEKLSNKLLGLEKGNLEINISTALGPTPGSN